MQGTRIMLPKMQLVSAFTQEAEDAVYIGGARAVAIQVFCQNWNGSSGTGTIGVDVEEATHNSEEQFVTSSTSFVINEAPGTNSHIATIAISAISSFIRLKVVPDLSGGNSVDVWAQINLLGPR